MNELFSFQEYCADKLTKVTAGLIGDDMGLGKTIEAIEIDRRKRDLYGPAFKAKGKPLTLTIAPLSVLGSWLEHFTRWAPHLKVKMIDSKNRAAFLKDIQQGKHDVYIMHWEALRLMPELQKIHWFHIIADEAHRAKNRKAQQTVALKKLYTDHKLAASGTPADNKPDDFWSVLNWLYPKKFSAYWRFRNYHVLIKHHNEGYCEAVDCVTESGAEKYHKRAFDEIVGTAHVDELMEQLEPFYVRRLKEEVWEEMPEKYYTEIEVDLLPEQRRAYEQMRRTMLAWVGKHEDQPVAAPVVIAQLTRLQQFACAYAKIEDNKLRLAEPSSKINAVMDLIEDNPDDQIVVFAQSKQVINMLAAKLAAKHISVGVLTGDTKQSDRPGLVEQFQDGKLRVFAGTIAAGGVGITLTAASRVVFIDRAWSPSINRQAEDRLHRIGQKNAVQVITIVAKDTIEPDRIKKIELKWSWIKEILGDKPTVLLAALQLAGT